VQWVRETAAFVTSSPVVTQTFTGVDAVDLYLTLDPATGTVQASYTTTAGTTTSAMKFVGGTQTIPPEWLTDPTRGLALGLISTLGGATGPLPVTWDFLETIDPVVTVAAPIKVNFQPANAAIPAGYLVDAGSTYAARGNGQTYGWNLSNVLNVVDRNSTLSPDQRYDTFASSQVTGAGSVWEIAVPNGTYAVRIVAGDATVTRNATYRYTAEGVTVVNGSPTTSARWVDGTQNVTVADGRLTIANGGGAKGNKIDFIEITPVSQPIVTPSVSVAATTPAAAEPATNGAFTVTRSGSTAAALTVNLAVAGTATNGVDYNQIFSTVTIPAGAASVVVPVTVKDDTLVEGAETAILTVTPGTGYTVGTASATVTIADNDSASTVPTLPGTLQAEDFDNGPSGTAYFDLDAANQGGAYRSTAVDIVAKAGGGYVVGYTRAGEWLAYTVDITGGTYTIGVSAASGTAGGTVHFEVDGVDVTGPITITGTGGWDTYQTFTKSNITLPAGRHVVKFAIDSSVFGGDVANFDAFTFTLAAAAKPAGLWAAGTSMPTALGEVATGVVGDTMYLVGEGSSQTLAYDFITKAWRSNVAVRPFVGNHHAAVSVGGKWYLFGGIGGSSEGKVQVYNPATNAWSTGAAMPWAGGSVSAGLLANGKVVVAGGIVGSTTVNNAAIYDPATNTWASAAAMPAGRNHAAAATDGTKFYVFGGRTGGNVVSNGFNTVQVYDPATNTWQSSDAAGSTIAPLPVARGGMGTAVYRNGEFFVIGGETLNGTGATATNTYNRVDVYNPLTNTWRLGAAMPTARHGIYPALYNGQIYVAGGGTQSGSSASAILEILNPDAG
jgi:N-acetylneuraminic acid mutarotase